VVVESLENDFADQQPARQLLAGYFLGLVEESPPGAKIRFVGVLADDPWQRSGGIAVRTQGLLDRAPAELRFQALDFVFVQGNLFQAAMDLVCDGSHKNILLLSFFRFSPFLD
jgi:hypothetical protein